MIRRLNRKRLQLFIILMMTVVMSTGCKDEETDNGNASGQTANAISNLVVINTSAEEISVTWDNPANTSELSRYEITRNGDSITSIDTNTTQFVDDSVLPNSDYTYAVMGYSSGNQLRFTKEVAISTPAIGIELTQTIDSNRIKLTWALTAYEGEVTHYEIRRNNDSLSDNATSPYTDAAVSQGWTYFYQIIAFNDTHWLGNTGMTVSAPLSNQVLSVSEKSSAFTSTAIRKDQGSLPVIKAFPSAEGFGAKATGGRGGRVIKVTNLNANGPGSLQAALNQNEPRIIIFTVGGVIEADIIHVQYGDVTIAGQTAPGGITLNGRLYGQYVSRDINNIIIRHLRVRPPEFDPNLHGGSTEQYDAIQFSKSHNVILDHVSVAFDGVVTVNLYEAQDVTVQWSTIQAAMISSLDTDGNSHRENNTKNFNPSNALINGPDGGRISLHHNLFAHNRNSNPALASGPAEVINNVMYNVRHAFQHSNPASDKFNIISNYIKRGPDNHLFPFVFDDDNQGVSSTLAYHISDNFIDDPDVYVGSISNPWVEPYVHASFNSLGLDETFRNLDSFDFSETHSHAPITTHDSTSAYHAVLTRAGAFPRDMIDQRIVDETQTRTRELRARIPADLAGSLIIQAYTTDVDNDGMRDIWESSNGLTVGVADHNTIMPSGYTAIEEYINTVADNLTP